MLGISDYWAFIAAVLVFLMLPGPGTVAVLTSTAKGGLRGGYAALAGLMIGDWLLMLAALVGVAALLAAHPMLFRSVQWLGVVYLVWVGLQLLRANGKAKTTPLPIAPGTYFRQGFLITLINPKAIVFYMAFFPLFIDPARHQGLLTFGVMALTIAVLTFVYCLVVILITHFAADRMRASPRIAAWLNRIAGTMLVGFGVKLSVS